MALIDYEDVASKVLAVINDLGRDVTLQTLERTSTDTNRPWLGPDAAATAVPVREAEVKAVFVDPLSSGLGLKADTLESFLKQSEQIMLLPPDPDLLSNIDLFDTVVDGDVTWRITLTHTLKPADTVMLYYVGVKR